MTLAQRIATRLQISSEEANKKVENLQVIVMFTIIAILGLIVAFFWPAGGGIETVPVLVDSHERGDAQVLKADGLILTYDRLSKTSKGVVVTIQVEGRRVYYTVPTDSGQDQFIQLLPDSLRYEIQPGDWEIVGNTIEARYTRSLRVAIVFFLGFPLIFLALLLLLIHNRILSRQTVDGRSLNAWRSLVPDQT